MKHKLVKVLLIIIVLFTVFAGRCSIPEQEAFVRIDNNTNEDILVVEFTYDAYTYDDSNFEVITTDTILSLDISYYYSVIVRDFYVAITFATTGRVKKTDVYYSIYDNVYYTLEINDKTATNWNLIID